MERLNPVDFQEAMYRRMFNAAWTLQGWARTLRYSGQPPSYEELLKLAKELTEIGELVDEEVEHG